MARITMSKQRVNPTHSGFIFATLCTMVGLAACVSLAGAWVYRPACDGLISGSIIAISLFVIAMQAGRVLAHSSSFGRTMSWLLLSQFVLWVGVALLLTVAKVHPIGFVVGVSMLPVAVLVTWGWYVVSGRDLSL